MKKIIIFLLALTVFPNLYIGAINIVYLPTNYNVTYYNNSAYDLETGIIEASDYMARTEAFEVLNGTELDIQYYHYVLFWDAQGAYIGYKTTPSASFNQLNTWIGNQVSNSVSYPSGAKTIAFMVERFGVDRLALGQLTYDDVFNSTVDYLDVEISGLNDLTLRFVFEESELKTTGKNLVFNGNGEQGLNGWMSGNLSSGVFTPSSVGTLTRDNTHFNYVTNGGFQAVAIDIPVTPNKFQRYSGKWQTSNGTIYAIVNLLDKNKTYISQILAQSSTTSTTEVSFSSSASTTAVPFENVAFVRLIVAISNSGTIKFREIQLEEGIVASAYEPYIDHYMINDDPTLYEYGILKHYNNLDLLGLEALSVNEMNDFYDLYISAEEYEKLNIIFDLELTELQFNDLEDEFNVYDGYLFTIPFALFSSVKPIYYTAYFDDGVSTAIMNIGLTFVFGLMAFGLMTIGLVTNKAIFNLFAIGAFLAFGVVVISNMPLLIVSIGGVIFNVYYAFWGGRD